MRVLNSIRNMHPALFLGGMFLYQVATVYAAHKCNFSHDELVLGALNPGLGVVVLGLKGVEFLENEEKHATLKYASA